MQFHYFKRKKGAKIKIVFSDKITTIFKQNYLLIDTITFQIILHSIELRPILMLLNGCEAF